MEHDPNFSLVPFYLVVTLFFGTIILIVGCCLTERINSGEMMFVKGIRGRKYVAKSGFQCFCFPFKRKVTRQSDKTPYIFKENKNVALMTFEMQCKSLTVKKVLYVEYNISDPEVFFDVFLKEDSEPEKVIQQLMKDEMDKKKETSLEKFKPELLAKNIHLRGIKIVNVILSKFTFEGDLTDPDTMALFKNFSK